MKRNKFVLGLLVIFLAFGLILSGCGDLGDLLGGGGDDNNSNNNTNNSSDNSSTGNYSPTSGKPTTLSSNASVSEAITKLNQIIAYCDANPNANNTSIKSQASSYKTSIPTIDSATWNASGSSIVSFINSLVNSLEAGSGSSGDSTNGNNGNTGDDGKTGTGVNLIKYIDGRLSELYPGIYSTTAADLVVTGSGGMVSSWSEFLSYGCELYVDNTKVTFGNTIINATSWITVYIPSEESTNTGSNDDGYTHAMPGKLSDYASLSEAIDRVNLISWYCTSYPSTTNDAVLLNVTSFMSALVSVDSYEWSVSGSYYISVLNSYIDQLE